VCACAWRVCVGVASVCLCECNCACACVCAFVCGRLYVNVCVYLCVCVCVCVRRHEFGETSSGAVHDSFEDMSS